MFEVSVSGSFAAAHQLRRADGTLEPVHEHDWQVQVTCAGHQLNELGVLVDFVALRARLDAVLARLDGHRLNDLPALAERGPSAENVARYVAEQMAAEAGAAPGLSCVEVEEERGCRARYWPEK
jgi:6-pyruvoyltetrahydropterin/6-carboxytetrahydropterin synthase